MDYVCMRDSGKAGRQWLCLCDLVSTVMWVVCMVMCEFRQGEEQVGRPSWELRFITCVVLWNKRQKVRVDPVLLCRDDPDRHNGASAVPCSPARRQILYANRMSQLQAFWNVLFICVCVGRALGRAWVDNHAGVITRVFEAKANQTSHGSVIWWMRVYLFMSELSQKNVCVFVWRHQ